MNAIARYFRCVCSSFTGRHRTTDSRGLQSISIMVILAAAMVFSSFFAAYSQVVNNEAEPTPTPDSKSDDIQVGFDDDRPGLLTIIVGGTTYLVDANEQTVRRVDDELALDESPKIEDGKRDVAIVEDESVEDDEEFDPWEFERGEEPYDYRLVNVPTPKPVPKGTWNLSFSHRFSQPLHPISESGKNLLGFDSFSVSSFGITYGITDDLYVNASRSPICQRNLCRTIEIGLGYNWLSEDKDTPVSVSTLASVEGDENFSKHYTFNLQTMMSKRVSKRIYLFFSPALHINSNGQGRFNPRPTQFFPPAKAANNFKLPKHTGSFGFGTAVLIAPDLLGTFEFTPRVGFKLGRVNPIFDENFNIVDFENRSEPTIGFGIQKNVGDHAFALTFTNSQTTTTSRYNSSNLVLKPRRLIIGFNLFRRF